MQNPPMTPFFAKTIGCTMGLLSSSPPPPRLAYALCCVGEWYALSPLLPGYGTSPPLCALVPGLMVGDLLVFGLLGWLLGWLVGCWTAEFGWPVGWLVGWLVGCVVGCLLASCWGACVCVAWTHGLWCCCTLSRMYACLCSHCKGLWGVVHISFRRSGVVLVWFSTDVLASEAAPLERR